MIVTAFSDASFCPDTQAAAWAGWVKSDRGRVTGSGVIRVGVINSNEAEFCAVANTLAFGDKRGVLQPHDWTIVQTDNLRVQAVLAGAVTYRLTPREYQAVTWVKDLVNRLSLRLDVRHVKGHRGTMTPRNAVNSLCDEAARQHMRQERARRRC